MTSQSSSRGDRWVGMVTLLAAVPLFYMTFHFPTFDWDPLGMAFWPRLLLGLLGMAAVWLMLGRGRGDHADADFTPGAIVFVLGAIGYVFLVPVAGFHLASFAGLVLYGLCLQPLSLRALTVSVLVAALATGTVFLIFEMGMNVTFPSRLLNFSHVAAGSRT